MKKKQTKKKTTSKPVPIHMRTEKVSSILKKRAKELTDEQIIEDLTILNTYVGAMAISEWQEFVNRYNEKCSLYNAAIDELKYRMRISK